MIHRKWDLMFFHDIEPLGKKVHCPHTRLKKATAESSLPRAARNRRPPDWYWFLGKKPAHLHNSSPQGSLSLKEIKELYMSK